MKPVESSEKKLKPLEAKLAGEINHILDLQHEIAGMQEQLDVAFKEAAKQSFPKGEVVSVEKLVAVKEISASLSIKSDQNENLVRELYHSIFPGDIFISQHYFEVWVKVGSNTVVKFADDLSGIEVKVLEDLN